MLVLRNARVVRELTEGYEGSHCDIVIENDIIEEIRPARSANASEECILDMTGNTVTPGLIEGHLHLDVSGDNLFEENVLTDAYRTVCALKRAQDNLKMGYTTVRDVGDRNDIVIDLAQAVDAGLAVGPDILPSGRIITPTEKGNDYFGTMYIEADSTDEYVKAVRQQYQRGAKWIKIMATGSVMNPGGEPGSPIIFERELKAACDTAAYVNLPVAVHCHGSEGIKMCIHSGVRTVEHSSILDEECLRMYKATNQTFMIPTASATYALVELSDRFNFPPHYVEKAKQIVTSVTEGLREAYARGIKMGWGTDAGVYPGSHANGIYEFEVRVDRIGMKPVDVLLQATKNNAEIFRIDDTVGTIKVGKRANLACFKGNPDMDYRALRDVQAVIKAGKLVI